MLYGCPQKIKVTMSVILVIVSGLFLWLNCTVAECLPAMLFSLPGKPNDSYSP